MSFEHIAELRLIVVPLARISKAKLGWLSGSDFSHWALSVRDRVYEVSRRVDEVGQPQYSFFETDKDMWLAEKASENREIKKNLLVGHTTVADDKIRSCGMLDTPTDQAPVSF